MWHRRWEETPRILNAPDRTHDGAASRFWNGQNRGQKRNTSPPRRGTTVGPSGTSRTHQGGRRWRGCAGYRVSFVFEILYLAGETRLNSRDLRSWDQDDDDANQRIRKRSASHASCRRHRRQRSLAPPLPQHVPCFPTISIVRPAPRFRATPRPIVARRTMRILPAALRRSHLLTRSRGRRPATTRHAVPSRRESRPEWQ